MNRIESQLVDGIKPELEQFGFKYIKTDRCFRKRNEVIQMFILAATSRADYTSFAPVIAIQVPEALEVFARSLGLSDNVKKEMNTLIASLHRISKNQKYDPLIVRVDEDLDRARRDMTDRFKNIALPFFRTHDTLPSVDAALNPVPVADTVFAGIGWSRYAMGLITAALCDRDDFEALLTEYRKRVKGVDRGFYVEKFEKVVAYLQQHHLPKQAAD